MMIIDGKKIASEISVELKQKVDLIKGRKPCLALIIVGDNPSSIIYVRSKEKKCAEIGLESKIYRLDRHTSEDELLNDIDKLNQDENVDGILVQMPLPKHINEQHACEAITPKKDVDGFNPYNVGGLLMGSSEAFASCTPLGIKTLLEKYKIDPTGKHVVILGRSNIVGKPMASLMLQKKAFANATVTVAHSRTQNLEAICSQADILISAIGSANFVKREMVKEGAVVIDVGINRVEDSSLPKGYRIVGDVDFNGVLEKVSYITPVPGGVGPMTVVMLIQNTLKSYYSKITGN